MFLEKELKKLEHFFQYADRHNGKVSQKNIGWHLDHSLKSIILIIGTLKKSNPSDYRWHFNMVRLFVHTTGRIPRGKGKTPERAQSFEIIKNEDLIAQLQTAKNELETLHTLHPKSNFRHPYFGLLNLKQGKRFLLIHTRHHLKIIRDIMR